VKQEHERHSKPAMKRSKGESFVQRVRLPLKASLKFPPN
jgi:hypothetical protein